MQILYPQFESEYRLNKTKNNQLVTKYKKGDMVELVDTMDLKSIVFYKREGSNPSVPIINIIYFRTQKYGSSLFYVVAFLDQLYKVYYQ